MGRQPGCWRAVPPCCQHQREGTPAERHSLLLAALSLLRCQGPGSVCLRWRPQRLAVEPCVVVAAACLRAARLLLMSFLPCQAEVICSRGCRSAQAPCAEVGGGGPRSVKAATVGGLWHHC